MTQPTTTVPIHTTSVDQPIGDIVPNWTPRPHPLDNPQYHTLQGQYCQLELLNSKTNENIIQQLYDVFKPIEQTHFTYLHYGPFKTIDEFKQFIHLKELPSSNSVFYTILVNDIAVGFISYLRINPDHGSIEIGHVNFSSQLVRTRAATETHYLLLQYAFDVLGYRRVEWSCYSLNTKSRQAALRLGFKYESTFLKSEICKGRSRDNAWFSITDDEWTHLKPESQRWLHSDNFDSQEQQLTKLNTAQITLRRNRNTDFI